MPYSILPGIDVPVIDTARLRLRRHALADFPDCAAMWADPIVTRYIGGVPASEHQVWARLLKYAGLWSLLGFGYWALEERATGRYIGELGFAEFKRALEPSIEGTPELGWALVSSASGRGYATEAVTAAVAWGEQRFGAGALTACIISPDNLASIRVATKCGYRSSGIARYGGEEILLYTRSAA
jgi:RimJ/RimL family protein N-acetyltransferase